MAAGGSGDAKLIFIRPEDQVADKNDEDYVLTSDLNNIDKACLKGDGDVNLITTLSTELRERYNQLARVIEGTGVCPEKCCFVEEGQQYEPLLEEYYDIRPAVEKDIFEEYKSMWLNLKERDRDALYFLLVVVARSLFRRVVYDSKSDSWIPRGSLTTGENISQLLYYGRTQSENQRGDSLKITRELRVMDSFQDGRTVDQMAQAMQNILKAKTKYHALDDVLQSALTSGMTNGCGHAGVYSLLDEIAGLVAKFQSDKLFPHGLPKLIILNVTAPLDRDGISIVSSPPSVKTRSNNSDETTPSKRQRVDEHGKNPGKMSEVKKKGIVSTSGKKMVVTGPSHSKKLIDLTIAYKEDSPGGVTKCLLVVAIHSRGKSHEQALKKFYCDVVAVLQAQNIVFGLLFGKAEVTLITCSKENSVINTTEKKYSLVRRKDRHDLFNAFNVEGFQTLVMDIFSLMIYGMRNIEA